MSDLLYRVYEYVSLKHKTTAQEICKELQESRKEISSVISQLIVKQGWVVEKIKGRVYIMDSVASGGENRVVVRINRRDGIKAAVVVKQDPEPRDWEVRSTKPDTPILHFDKKYTPSEVRYAYSRIVGVKLYETRNVRFKEKI